MAVRHHIKVLVVDEDASTCAVLESQLAREGFRPTAYTDAGDALERASKGSCQIGVVSLVEHPWNGFETMDRLRQLNPSMHVLATSARPTLEIARRAMRGGARALIAKPIDFTELVGAVERASHELGLIHTNDEELNRQIGRRIRAERLAHRLTLQQLSDRTDLTTSQLSQVELGKNAASIWSLARISNALGHRMSEMLDGL